MTETLSREQTLTLHDLNRLPLPLDFIDSAALTTLSKLGFCETYFIKDTKIKWVRITTAGKMQLSNIRVKK